MADHEQHHRKPWTTHAYWGAYFRRLWDHGRHVEIMQRSLAFAALFFVTLVPLLVVIAAAEGSRSSGIAQWVTDALGLNGQGAESVKGLFVTRRQTLSTTTGVSLAALAVFGISLMASVQAAYERIWNLPRGPWHTTWRQTVGLAGLIGYILLAEWSGTPGQHTPAQPALRVAATVLGGVALFWWLQWLLLGSRIPWSRLLPGAVATVAALAGLRLFSRFILAPLLVMNAVSYGTVGTVLIVQSFLIGVGYTLYAGCLAGQALTPPEVAPTTDTPPSDVPPSGLPPPTSPPAS
ncbi:YhjD/YihY/BrkB family envelope integrity protein [Streptacidiphilus melanogenes]|uniref:YhjD/YihY/BrkB family envelope integrity protein n=1 Tax=Streptacidiphilus melanogenes TaxID=411235 RepID=UPI0006948534|nr:YhjD/YihY/BrkB family envelope integrity protein [Streptacidiphilus melanogenes]